MSQKITKELLAIEHTGIAYKLGFVTDPPKNIDDCLLYQAIGLIDILSRKSDEYSKSKAICLIAILWEYKNPDWQGLKDVFILFLSRMGFAPTATMTDKDFDRETMTHSSLQSYITELMIAIHQVKHEITVKGENFLLTEFQKDIWNKIDQSRVTGISAPTSAGKTFIILLKIIALLLEKSGTIVYIVPNLSLMSQISIDLRRLLKRFGLEEYEILTSYYGDYGDEKKIFVLTQERAIAAFSQKNDPFPELRVFVIDEIQNIEKVANHGDQRAKILFDTIFEFRQQTRPEKIILSGPRVHNIRKLCDELFQLEDKTGKSETLTSPVVNFTYSVIGTPKNLKFRQYSCITKTYREITIENTDCIAGLGQKLYTKEFHRYLNSIISSLGEMTNIIFSPTSKQARKTALAINHLDQKLEVDGKLGDLIEYIASTVHPNYALCHTLSNKVAYHHGKLPSHVRRVIEKALTEKIIQHVVCTTTLMQGVNLPVQNMIVRNPNMFIKKTQGIDAVKLSGYEFANLRGRAGRLLKDFIGRAFVLDEKSFTSSDDSEENTLFGEEEKELNPQKAYSNTFYKYEQEILSDLENNLSPKLPKEQPYHYLLPYIRQTIYKYGQKAQDRLRAVGISLSETTFSDIQEKLSALLIPVEICYKNRYWDPMDLDELFRNYNTNQIDRLPKHGSPGIAGKLHEIVLYFYENFPYYCDKYKLKSSDFYIKPGNKYGNLYRICKTAEEWQNEVFLADIFRGDYYSGSEVSEKIDDAISVLNNKVCFGLAMLLKPLADFDENSSAILNYIEMGAYHPAARKLIEIGIPRETAIYLKNEYFSNYTMETEDDLKRMIKFIKQIAPRLDYWVQVQLESIV